jgi:hypothetical protein
MLGVMLLFTVATPAQAFDQYPKWGRNSSNVIENYLMSAYSPYPRVDDVWATYALWNTAEVWNDTGATYTVRLKMIPYSADKIEPNTPFTYHIQGAGVTGSCWLAASPADAWGCQLTIPDGGQANVLIATRYTGAHSGTTEWFQLQYLMYTDDYATLITAHNTYVTLH